MLACWLNHVGIHTSHSEHNHEHTALLSLRVLQPILGKPFPVRHLMLVLGNACPASPCSFVMEAALTHGCYNMPRQNIDDPDHPVVRFCWLGLNWGCRRYTSRTDASHRLRRLAAFAICRPQFHLMMGGPKMVYCHRMLQGLLPGCKRLARCNVACNRLRNYSHCKPRDRTIWSARTCNLTF